MGVFSVHLLSMEDEERIPRGLPSTRHALYRHES